VIGGTGEPRGGGCAPFPAGLDRAQHDPQDQPDHQQVTHHLDHGGDPGPVGHGDDVAEATVENTVMVKYKASVRLRGSLNAWGWASASMT
jgi:hypothetical protein